MTILQWLLLIAAFAVAIVALVWIGGTRYNWQRSFTTQTLKARTIRGTQVIATNTITTDSLTATNGTFGALDAAELKVNGVPITTNGSSSNNTGGGGGITLQPPQITQIVAVGAGVYNPPAGALYLYVRAQGGGAGGSASDDGGGGVTPPGNGTATIFTDGSGTLTANGAVQNVGGTFSIVGFQGIGFPGNAGDLPFVNGAQGPTFSPQPGGGGVYGGATYGTTATFGSGGSGAVDGTPGSAVGFGGGSGGYVEGIVSGTLAASYSYTIGSGGAPGLNSGFGTPGNQGGNGWLIVTAYFQ